MIFSKAIVWITNTLLKMNTFIAFFEDPHPGTAYCGTPIFVEPQPMAASKMNCLCNKMFFVLM